MTIYTYRPQDGKVIGYCSLKDDLSENGRFSGKITLELLQHFLLLFKDIPIPPEYKVLEVISDGDQYFKILFTKEDSLGVVTGSVQDNEIIFAGEFDFSKLSLPEQYVISHGILEHFGHNPMYCTQIFS